MPELLLAIKSTVDRPEAVARRGHRREEWFSAYAATVVERATPGISTSPRTAELPQLLRLVAARHASVLNVADLAADNQRRHPGHTTSSLRMRVCRAARALAHPHRRRPVPIW